MHERERSPQESEQNREVCIDCDARLGELATERTVATTRMGVPLHPEVAEYIASESVQQHLERVGQAAVQRFAQGQPIPDEVKQQIYDDAFALEEEQVVGKYPIRMRYLEKARSRQSKERLSALGIPQKDQDHAFTQLNDGLERIERTRQAEILGAEALLAAHLELE